MRCKARPSDTGRREAAEDGDMRDDTVLAAAGPTPSAAAAVGEPSTAAAAQFNDCGAAVARAPANSAV